MKGATQNDTISVKNVLDLSLPSNNNSNMGKEIDLLQTILSVGYTALSRTAQKISFITGLI